MTKKEIVRQQLKDILLTKGVPSYQRYNIYKCANTIDRMNRIIEFLQNNINGWMIIRKSRNGKLSSIELSNLRNERVDICVLI